MKTPLDWGDPEVRRVPFIVIALFAVGLIIQMLAILGLLWLLEQMVSVGWIALERGEAVAYRPGGELSFG